MAALVYGGLLVIALCWAVLRGEPNLYRHPSPWITQPGLGRTATSVVLGLLVAGLTVLSTRLLVRHTRWARRLHREFRDLLCPLTPGEIAGFAICSGIAEEALFRGVLQPSVGLWAAAAIFGAVHLGPSRRFAPWTLWAFLMGFVFGVLYLATGELIGPAVAHVGINYANLRFIERHDPAAPAPA